MKKNVNSTKNLNKHSRIGGPMNTMGDMGGGTYKDSEHYQQSIDDIKLPPIQNNRNYMIFGNVQNNKDFDKSLTHK